MRYILLIIIAILLPVFAFLNFTYKTDIPGISDRKSENQTATLTAEADISGNSTTSVNSASSSETVVTLANDPKDSEENGGVSGYLEKFVASISGNDAGEVAEPVREQFILPRATYTHPSNFPSTSIITQPYLERLNNPSFVPLRNWDIDYRDIDSEASLVIQPGDQKILYNKNIFAERPVASLTKMMTALVVISDMNLKDEVAVSRKAVETYGEMGGLVLDEKLTVENLLYIMLISSSNDAAVALEEYYNAYLRVDESSTFVSRMNRKAQELKLFDTFFVEPSGLDASNTSTAYDIARLADYAFSVPILRQVMSTSVMDIPSLDGVVNHHVVNSNKLLGVIPGVLGGKTGYTEEAGESIALFVKKEGALEADDYLVYVILGSTDRTKAARQLIEWVEGAYIWE